MVFLLGRAAGFSKIEVVPVARKAIPVRALVDRKSQLSEKSGSNRDQLPKAVLNS